MSLVRALGALFTVAATVAAPSLADEWAPRSLSCEGIAKQSGLLRCAGPANTEIKVSAPDGALLRTVKTDPAGHVLIGLKQDEPASISLETVDGMIPPITLAIAPRNDDFRLLRNLECDKVDARTEEQKALAIASWVKKRDAFESFNRGPTVGEGFRRPAEGAMSSPFGPTRKYVGTRADGTTCEKVSVFLHLSQIGVEPGTFVPQGEQIGETGNTGRTTGPHLHWAVKWRNPVAETRDEDFYIDPGLLLSFPD